MQNTYRVDRLNLNLIRGTAVVQRRTDRTVLQVTSIELSARCFFSLSHKLNFFFCPTGAATSQSERRRQLHLYAAW